MDTKDDFGRLWFFIRLSGINIFGDVSNKETEKERLLSEPSRMKILTYLPSFMVHLIPISQVLWLFVQIYKRSISIEVIFNVFISNLFAITIWYNVQWKKDEIEEFFPKFYHLLRCLRSNKKRIEKRKMKVFINLSLFLAAATSILLTMFYSFTVNETPEESIAFFLSKLAVTFLLLFYFLFQYLLPATIAVLISAFYYSTGNLLDDFNETVDDRGIFFTEASDVMDMFHLLHELVYFVEKEFSSISFLLMSWRSTDMCYLFVIFIKADKSLFSIFMYMEYIVPLIFDLFVLTGILICASKITMQVCEMKNFLELEISSRLGYDALNDPDFELLSFMKSIEFPRITAYGMNLNPTVAFATFGTLIMHALLLLSANK